MSVEISPTLASIPGDAAGIKSIADKFQRTAESIDKAILDLRQAIVNSVEADSGAVDAVKESAEIVGEKLDRLKGRYTTAGNELTQFSTTLESAQSQAAALVVQRDQWNQHIVRLQRQLANHHAAQPLATDPYYLDAIVTHRRESTRLRHSIATGNQELRQLQMRYESVVQSLEQSGIRAAGALRGAIDGDGLNDSAWKKFSNWVSENADILKKIHEVLGQITAALAIISLFIPVLAPFAVAVAALTAGLGLVLALTGEISWVDFALDVVGVLTVGVAAVAGKAVKGLVTGIKASRVAHLGNVAGKSPLRMVTGSFNKVLQGTKGVKVGGAQLPTVRWAREVLRYRGVEAAHFKRIVVAAKAGAGGIDEAALIRQANAWINASVWTNNVHKGLGIADALLGERLPDLADRLRGWTDNTAAEGVGAGISDVLTMVSNPYVEFKDRMTWKVGG